MTLSLPISKHIDMVPEYPFYAGQHLTNGYEAYCVCDPPPKSS